MMLRNGVTCFAMLAGLACYYGAVTLFRFGQLAAGIAGLIFALLVWIAARSLLRDLLLEAARRQMNQTNTNGQQSSATPPQQSPDRRHGVGKR